VHPLVEGVHDLHCAVVLQGVLQQADRALHDADAREGLLQRLEHVVPQAAGGVVRRLGVGDAAQRVRGVDRERDRVRQRVVEGQPHAGGVAGVDADADGVDNLVEQVAAGVVVRLRLYDAQPRQLLIEDLKWCGV